MAMFGSTNEPSTPGPEDIHVDPLVREVYENRKKAVRHQADWRTEARECYEFRDGKQWDSEDEAQLEYQGRPVVTFNRVAPVIDSIAGHEINNRQEVRYIPRTPDDTRYGDVYTETARWVRDECDAEDEDSDAFQDALTCGLGWTETRVDYEEEPDGKIVIERVPPLEMRWDPSARKKNLVDARWLLRETKMDLSEVRQRWPDKADEIVATPDVIEDDEWIDEHDATNAWQYKQDQSWPGELERSGKTVVFHYQWRERENYWRVQDRKTGEIVTLTGARYETRREFIESAPQLVAVKQRRWRYRYCYINGRVLLETNDSPVQDFTWKAVTGKREEQHYTWYGLMRAMKDPQKWANKFFSQIMHIFNSNPKGGLLVEQNAVEDIRKLEEKWASPDGVTELADGAITAGRLQQLPQTGYPPSLDKMLSFAISSIRDCSGINLELLGMADREQASVLETQRKQAALIILSPILASLRRYRKIQGRLLLEMMREYIPEGKVIRITNDRQVQFMRDDDVVKYDIIIDQAPTSPNLKQEVWGAFNQLLPPLIKAGYPVPKSILDFTPLPAAVAEDWKREIEERTKGPSPEQLKQMQEQLQKLGQENQQLKAKAQDKSQELQLKHQEFQAEMALKVEEAKAEMQLKEQEMLNEQRIEELKLAHQAQLSQKQLSLKTAEINAKYDAEMKKLNAEVAIKSEGKIVDLEQHIRERMRRDAELEEIKQGKKEAIDLRQNQTDESIQKILSTLQDVQSAVESLREEQDEFESESEQRRKAVYGYIESRGGKAAQFVKRLRKIERDESA